MVKTQYVWLFQYLRHQCNFNILRIPTLYHLMYMIFKYCRIAGACFVTFVNQLMLFLSKENFWLNV